MREGISVMVMMGRGKVEKSDERRGMYMYVSVHREVCLG